MTENHPIIPPPELVHQYVAERAAQWGFDQAKADIKRERQEAADEELEEICEFLCTNKEWNIAGLLRELRAARRPKPPSLKEEALKELAWVDEHLNMPLHNHCTAIHTIRRALEQLDG